MPATKQTLALRFTEDADTLLVLDAIRGAADPVSHTGLRDSTRLTGGQLRSALRDLEKRALIMQVGSDGSADRHHFSLQPRPHGFVLAVDIGGTKLRAALADLHGEILEQIVVPTAQSDVAAQVLDVYRELLKRGGGGDRALAACIGIPAPYDANTDQAWNAGNLPVLSETAPAASVASALGVPVVVAQDARLAAIGERWRGHAKAVDNYVVICVGTGIGMGIVVNGRLYGGGLGGAGEICFLPLGTDPFAPEHQVRGPFEDAVSGPAIARHYAEAAGVTANGSDGPTRDTRAIFAAASAGEPEAISEVERVASLLALGVVSVKACLDPELVVLSGGVGSNPFLIEPLRRHTRRLTSRVPHIETSPLGDWGPLFGGIAVALGRAYTWRR